MRYMRDDYPIKNDIAKRFFDRKWDDLKDFERLTVERMIDRLEMEAALYLDTESTKHKIREKENKS
jgi:hypothetical protein